MPRACVLLMVMFSCAIAQAAAATPLAASCLSSPTTLCLNDQRFKLEVQWKDFQGNRGVGQAVPLTSDTGYFWFFSSSNVELVVKVLDGRGLNRHFWVFFGALSNVEYTMTVTDSVTGSVKTYFNPSGQFASVGDTEAFSANGISSSEVGYVEVGDSSMSAGSFTIRESLEDALPVVLPSVSGNKTAVKAVSTCVGTETSLCLNGGRFRVEVNWKDFQGNTGIGQAVPLTSDTGYFWFFSSTNIELVVKVLDGRALNNRFWVFYGALSNVEYEMTVTDTLTGNISTYSNPSGRFASTGDTEGFRSGHRVATRLDESRSVSGNIPLTGGTLSATGADGTLFTLTVPDGALFSDAEVSMTPVASIDGLPLSGGLSAAVQLGPEGLLLIKPAKLVIDPPTAIPIDEEITFAWRGSGEEFILYPPDPLDTPAISMSVTHLSGYGAGRGSSGDQAAQQQRAPANRDDQYKQELQNPAGAQRRARRRGEVVGKESGSVPSAGSNVRASDRRLLDAAIRVLTRHLNDDLFEYEPRKCSDDWKNFLSRVKSFEQDVILFAGSDRALMNAANTYYQGIHELIVRCYEEAYGRCKSDLDPRQGEEMWRIYSVLWDNSQEHRVIGAKIRKCLTFELTFNSFFTEHPDPGESFAWTHKVRAIVPLISPFGLGSWEDPVVQATLEYEPGHIGSYGSGCSVRTRGRPDQFRVTDLKIDMNLFEGNRSPANRLTMGYDIGQPVIIYTVNCPQGSATFETRRWDSLYAEHRVGCDCAGSFMATEWTIVGSNAPYAFKTYDLNSRKAKEATRMELKHTPQ